jgi:hypothetical protein
MIAAKQFASYLAAVVILVGSGISSVAQNPSQTSPSKHVAVAPRHDDTALKDDIRKMRVILDQMQTNLTFVGSSTTPLNHQFQLEIDMWRALLDHMERNVDGMAEPKQANPER